MIRGKFDCLIFSWQVLLPAIFLDNTEVNKNQEK